jgi:hypothetical protein
MAGATVRRSRSSRWTARRRSIGIDPTVGTALRMIGDSRPCSPHAVSRAGGPGVFTPALGHVNETATLAREVLAALVTGLGRQP